MKIKLSSKTGSASRTVKAPAKTVAKGKGKTVAKAAPAPVAIVALKAKTETFACIGTRGIACFPARFDGQSIQATEQHDGKAGTFLPITCKLGEPVTVAWKGEGDASLSGKALRAWVSEAGKPVRFVRLVDAIRTKLVIVRKGTADGKACSLFLPVGWKPEHKTPQYVGTDRAGGRIETRAHPDGKARQGVSFVKDLTIK